MSEYEIVTGNYASAYGAKLSKAEVIAAYPITPQTSIVEKIADFVANGEMDTEYVQSDSSSGDVQYPDEDSSSEGGQVVYPGKNSSEQDTSQGKVMYPDEDE